MVFNNHFFFFFLASCSAVTIPFPSQLTTEARVSPLGIDTQSPRFSWVLPLPTNDNTIRAFGQSAYQLQLSLSVAGVPVVLWDTGQVNSSSSSLIPYTGTVLLKSDSLYSWCVRVWYTNSTLTPSPLTPPSACIGATFRTGLFALSDWSASSWISGPSGRENVLRSSPFFLPAGKSVSSAIAYATGLGYMELYINGVKASTAGQGGGGESRKQDPGWTSFAHRVRYIALDVTSLLLDASTGETNIIGVMLGNGWYMQPPYLYPSATNGGGFSYTSPPITRVLLRIEFTDGTSMIQPSLPSTWDATNGPVIFDSLYDGEWYNGTTAAALEGWCSSSSSSSVSWVSAIDASNASPATTNATLSAQKMEPITTITTMQPISWWATDVNTTVYDFGRNTAGVLRVVFPTPGDVNQPVVFQHAETLQHPPFGPANGSLYIDGLRNAHARDVYFMSGDPNGGEMYEPRFTVHGFRYASISGAPAPLTPDSVTMIVQRNAVQEGGEIAMGSPLLDTIQQAVLSSISSNFQWGPGSCTNRDERQFFTGDTSLGVEISLLNYRLLMLYEDWIDTVLDEQNGDGSVGYYAPTPITDTRDGSPNWITGFPTAVWMLWHHYGDVAVVNNSLPALLRYAAFLQLKYNQTCSDGNLSTYWAEGPGEWVNLGPAPMMSLVNAFALLHDISMISDLCFAVNDVSNGEYYKQWFGTLLSFFHTSFFNPSTFTYGHGTQTEQSMALFIGAPSSADATMTKSQYHHHQQQQQQQEQQQQQNSKKNEKQSRNTITQSVVDALVNDILVTNAGHILTGILGTRFIFEVLARYGRSDVALAVLLNTSYPSYGWMVSGDDNPEPATSIWEEWDTYQENAIMASRNHLMFASVGTFFYQRLVGILPLAPGYTRTLIAPQHVSDWRLPFASAQLQTPQGLLRVAWSVSNSTKPTPPPGGTPVTCGEADEANEGDPLNFVNLTCGTAAYGGGGNISSIAFASFGTPTGSCAENNLAIDPACNSVNSSSVVMSACEGKNNCSLQVSVSTFGTDPCSGTKKSLGVQVNCSGNTPLPPPPPPPPANGTSLSITLDVTIPSGMVATVLIPIVSSLSSSTVVVTEGVRGGEVIWVNNTFVGGGGGQENGIVSGAVANSTISAIPALEFVLLSGTYSLVAVPASVC